MSGARNTDPPTSWMAAGPDKGKRPSYRYMQLLAYYVADLNGAPGLNYYEAALAAGIEVNSQICYWKRASELKDWGAIATIRDESGNSLKRPGGTDNEQEVHAITDYGRRAVVDPSLIMGDLFEKTTLIGRQVMRCGSLDELRDLWRFHQYNKTLTEDVQRVLKRRARQLKRKKRP